MARRAPVAAVESPGRFVRGLKQVLMGTMIVCSIIAAFWAYSTVDHFLVSDSRFFLPGPPEPGERSSFFRIEGAKNITDEQVIQVFARDFGRSIYLCPLGQRRLKLLSLDWVKEASISRLWPNRLVVRITERKPAAFTQMPAADGTTLLWMVDADGVLLDPQRAMPFKLPVLIGMPRTEPEAVRRERMKRFLRLQTELDGYMTKISEIDVADSDNLKVIEPFDGRAIVLMLGNQEYRTRYENFLNNQDEIKKRLPDAAILDLRLRDRITGVASKGASR